MKILIPNDYQKAVIRTLISEELLPSPPLRLCETKKAMNYFFSKAFDNIIVFAMGIQ